ncbi:MAG TPA: methyltransferase [Chryseosolibacter sp.]
MRTRGDFRFKKFSISHDASTHKVGTDGVLLGAWVNVDGVSSILDIGTGSGVIAIMLAQRTPDHVVIEAVELQEQDAIQAEKNVKNSPWPTKVRVIHTPVQQFRPGKQFDLIVSNPPFFVNSWLPPDKNRSKARHSNELSFEDLLEAVTHSLSATGRFAVVLPFTEGNHFIRLAEGFGLHAHRQMSFRSRKEKPIERLLIEFSRQEGEMKREELLLYKINEEWTDEYRRLTKDFYLNA